MTTNEHQDPIEIHISPVDAAAARFRAKALPSLQIRPDLLAHREIAFRAGWMAAMGLER